MTLDCPSDCPYLLQSREQAREQGGGQPGQAEGQGAMWESEIPQVEIQEQFLYEREELILGLSFALAKSARADRSLVDGDLIAAVSGLAQSYQTLVNSTLIYERPTANVGHQNIVREVETLVREFREAEQRHVGEMPGRMRLRDSDVLKALVFILRMGLGRTSGRPKSRGFVDFLFAQFPEKRSPIAGAKEAGGIIIP